MIRTDISLTNCTLPVNDLKNDILDALNSHNRLILRAPTGSGKSTQVPQFILDNFKSDGKILILQPRRLAARMLASRVAQERSSSAGQEIGFQTRFETAFSDDTRAVFITEGILTRIMLGNPHLKGIQAVIFDEFHERNLTSDTGLALVTALQRRCREDLKIIVMSATIDITPLQEYLEPASVITSGGRTFPIDIRYSPSIQTVPVWEQAAKAVSSLVNEGKEGDILVFMPGVYEIRRTIESIERNVRGEPLSVYPLYGDLPADRQNQVMEKSSRRKIIVATNIAETSLTISGVRHVVDSGLARVNRFDSARGFNTLFTEYISRDSADQRAGRAGREAPGTCTRLWSRQKQSELLAHTTPEIHRVDLSETVLSILNLGFSAPGEFPWFEAPHKTAVTQAQETLFLLGAIDNQGSLTPLAGELCRFPMHPRLARLILEASRRHCLHLATFCAALLSERSALAGKPDFPEEAYTQEISSDFFAQYTLIKKINASGFDQSICARYAVNSTAARNILRTQALFLDICHKLGMSVHDSQDAPESIGLCLLLAYPDHLAARRDKGTLICRLRDGRRGVLNDKSLARGAQLLVATDIREKKDANSEIKTTLSLATEIKEEWLSEYFGDQFTTEDVCEWNQTNETVEERKLTSCLGVIIHDTIQNEISSKVSSVLAETIISKNIQLPYWDESVNDFITRIQWLGTVFPEQHFPAFTDDEKALVIHELCDGESRLSKVRAKPVLPFVRNLLACDQLQFADAMAPSFITLQSGRKLRIIYDRQSEPRIRARIQELYGMQSTPRIADNRVSVLIEVLAPNNRPVQITHDIAGFWTQHYPELKKTLSRRYPKHEWR